MRACHRPNPNRSWASDENNFNRPALFSPRVDNTAISNPSRIQLLEDLPWIPFRFPNPLCPRGQCCARFPSACGPPESTIPTLRRRLPPAIAGRYHKVLLPKQALAEIQKIVSEARQEHYFITLPWDDNGYRVLPAAAYMDHVAKMRGLSHRFSAAVDDLARQFRTTPDELRAKFSFETKVLPLPDAGDFSVALGNEEKDRIKRQITAAVEASLQVGTRELWFRLYEAVQHLADRLTAYKVTGEGVEHPFRDTVVTNLVKLVDVLPKLNITNDPELEASGRAGEEFATRRSQFTAQVRISPCRNCQSCGSNRAAHGRIHGWLFGSHD